MRELVRDEDPLVPRAIPVGALVRQQVDERRGADVLHPPEEVGDGGLRILRPRVLDPRQSRVHVDHVGGDPEEPAGEGAVLTVDVVVNRCAPPRVAQPDEGRDDEGHEVGGARQVLAPGHRVRAPRVPAVEDQPAVGHHRVTRRHRRPQLPRHLVVGEVVGREPVVIVHILTLAPDLLRTVGPALGRDEREALSVVHAPAVVDGEPRRVVKRHRLRRINDQGVAVRRKAQGPGPRARHPADREQLTRVQNDGVQPRSQRDERRGHAAGERRRVPIEIPDFDQLVHEVVVVRTRIGAVRDQLGVGLRGRAYREAEEQRAENG